MAGRRTVELPRVVFVDTSYVIALFFWDDEHHAAASAVAARIRHSRTRMVTTHAVLFEIGNALARPAHRRGGLAVLGAFETDPRTRILVVTQERYAAGRSLYDSRPDQSWGLTDCVSFAVMRELGLTAALTADRHFEQAGFRALLRDVGP